MRVQLFTTFFLCVILNGFSQITVTDADLVTVGDVIYKAYDDSPSSAISVGNSGSNQRSLKRKRIYTY